MGKIHPGCERHFNQNPSHRDVVRPFLSLFDVTGAGREPSAGGPIFTFFLHPERQVAELLGVAHELLLVYAPYSHFQSRTIATHDEVRHRERMRLDPMGSIIVTDDPNTGRHVREHLTRETERPPILGLAISDLAALTTASDLQTLFVDQFYRRDLFGLESPLKSDVSFFGRQDLVSQLLDRFRSGQNSGLFGLRRIGKSSVLYALERRCRAQKLGGVTYLDLSSPGMYGLRWWQLLQEIARAIAQPLFLERGDRTKTRALTLTYTESEAAGHFSSDIQHLRTFFTDHRLLLALDEIEYVTFGISPNEQWGVDFLPFWQTIRSVHQNTLGEFCFVLAGVNSQILETDSVGRFDNPLFSTVHPYYLQPLDAESVREMVGTLGRFMGITVEPALATRLAEEYGGHPYLVRQACSQLSKDISERPGQLTAVLFERKRSQIAVSLEKNVRQILGVLARWYPLEFTLIRDLAAGDRTSFIDFANLSADFTQHMEGYGLVKDARNNPKIRIGIVRDYLRAVAKSGDESASSASDLDALWVEISTRRNRLELQLRRIIYTGLRFKYAKRAAVTALSGLSTERREVLTQYSFEDLWQHTYFSELISIIRKNWDVFQNFFSDDADKVLTRLEHINEFRPDAHAKSIDEENLAFLRVAFRKTEDALRSA